MKKFKEIQGLDAIEENAEKEAKLQWDFNECLKREEALWRQKSRISWLTTPDLNTRFFHVTTIVRRRRNHMSFLKNEASTWTQGTENIGKEFVEYYSQLFKSKNPPLPDVIEDILSPVFSEDDNNQLCLVPSNEEIRDTLFSMGSLKSPGLDGLPPLFYKHYWSIVKKYVIGAVYNFFQSGRMLKQQNHTFIALIPKVEGASSIKQFRPISLCNVTYKIISKIIASRLKLLLPKVVSPWKGAFVPGRVIQDNSIIAHEVINAMKKSKSKHRFMALKMDMEKAYDRMEWSYLLKVMKCLGFNDKWIALVRECISTSSFSMMVNGSPHGMFFPSRGLRQDNSLSPFLFVLGSEVLSGILIKAEAGGKFKGFQLAQACPRISHLLFADDLIIFSRDLEEDAKAIKDCLDQYQLWSGQKVNWQKSTVMFNIKVPRGSQRAICWLTNLKSTHFHSKYLGLPYALINLKGIL